MNSINPKFQIRFESLKASGLLPSPKGPALAVVELTRQDSTSLVQLARAIQADPALVARLLKLANACRQPGTRPILATKDAIAILGLNAVRGLALGFSLMKEDQTRRCRAFKYTEFWSRNLACAVAMQAVTTSSGLMQSDEAFSLGLLSNVGELGMASLFPNEYSQLLESATPAGTSMLEREQQAFEFDHTDLGAALLADWGFPTGLIHVLSYRERSQSANFADGSRPQRLLLTIMLAARIAEICMAAPESRSALMGGLIELGNRLSMVAEDLLALCDRVVRDWTDWCRLLAVPSHPLPPFVELMNESAESDLKPEDKPSESKADGGLRLLVVVHDALVRAHLKQALGTAGYLCSEAENGRLGLARALAEQPDLMIVDGVLPEVDGVTLIRTLRESPKGNAVYVLFLSEINHEEQLVEAFAAGADGFLAKPVQPKVLLGRLLAGQRMAALHQEIKRDQSNLQRFAAEFAKLNARLQESRQRDAESQERMELALRGGGLGMWDLNLASKEVIFSERGCAMLGYRPEEIKPDLQSWRRLSHPDDWAAIDDAMRRHLHGETTTYECEQRKRHKDGHWVWILDRGQVVERSTSGAAVRIVGTHMDISDRKHAEIVAQRVTEQLRLDEERSRDFSTSASDWFWETDAEQRFCYFSDNFEKVYGLPPGRLLGKSRRDLLEHDELNPPEIIEAHLAQLATHQPFKNFEYRIRIADEDIRWVSVAGLPHFDSRGHFAGYRGTGAIISERKTNEEHLRQAMQMAQASNIAKSRFLATMSHEIRTPMNGMLGMAQLLLMPNLLESERRDYARTILSSGQTLLTLLNDILDLSKIEAGGLQLESTVFEPTSLIHETRTLFSGAATAKNLQFEGQWQGPSSQRYLGDSHRLRQMLANLVGNAIKFTLMGSVELAGREIERDGTRALLEFSVSDTGIGIAADKLDLLFKPFSQTDSSTTREFGGSGLGLSIVRNLAQAMGGDVGVDSMAGKGSKFWFRVRTAIVSQGEESRSAERAKQDDGAFGKGGAPALCGRVLLVEDTGVSRKVIESFLGKLGITVLLANDGQQAVDVVLQSQAPDLILMDIHMPVMDGHSATKRIRKWETDQQLARLPIVALTADAFEEGRLQCLASGMDAVLTKPVSFDALRLVLTRWLPKASQAPQVMQSPAEVRPVNAPAFAVLVQELIPLLEKNKFDAVNRFKALQTLVSGSDLAAAVDALELPLREMRFDLVLEGLRRIVADRGTRKLS